MDKHNKDKERSQDALLETYYRLHANGAGLYVRATPEEIAQLYVREESSYMPDYIYDENGSLIQVMFDRVNKD